jgi:predicted site-specific integrase-resolvase
VSTRHLNQDEVAERWGFSPRTLENWRCRGEGPRFLKIGGKVVYRLEDVEAFEQNQLRAKTASSGGRKRRAASAEQSVD